MNNRKIRYTGDVNLINERRYLINKGILNENEIT